MASGFKIAAVVLFSLAVLCLFAAIVLFFVWRIREVRDTLTGKTAQKRIAEMRSSGGRWRSEHRRFDAKGSVIDEAWDADDIGRNLNLASLGLSASDGAEAATGAAKPDTKNEYAGRYTDEDDENIGTTLLKNVPVRDVRDADDEMETHLGLGTQRGFGDKKDAGKNLGGDAEEYMATTLLGQAEAGSPDSSAGRSESADAAPSRSANEAGRNTSHDADGDNRETTLLGRGE